MTESLKARQQAQADGFRATPQKYKQAVGPYSTETTRYTKEVKGFFNRVTDVALGVGSVVGLFTQWGQERIEGGWSGKTSRYIHDIQKKDDGTPKVAQQEDLGFDPVSQAEVIQYAKDKDDDFTRIGPSGKYLVLEQSTLAVRILVVPNNDYEKAEVVVVWRAKSGRRPPDEHAIQSFAHAHLLAYNDIAKGRMKVAEEIAGRLAPQYYGGRSLEDLSEPERKALIHECYNSTRVLTFDYNNWAVRVYSSYDPHDADSMYGGTWISLGKDSKDAWSRLFNTAQTDHKQKLGGKRYKSKDLHRNASPTESEEES